MGKGSGRRPAQVTPDEVARRWDAVFGKPGKQPVYEQCKACGGIAAVLSYGEHVPCPECGGTGVTLKS